MGITDVTLTFAADKTFTMVESVRPMSEPAGTPPTSCVTTETYVGTYAAGANTLDLRFTGGTANAIVGCSAASAGTPMNQDEIAARKQEHEILAPMNAYSVSATTLVLTPTPSDPRILGLDVNATTYTRLD